MNDEQRTRILEIFRKAGYKGQVDVARAMEERGIYEGGKRDSLRAYLNQVLKGHRPASEKLAKGLAEVCEDETILEILTGSSSPETKLEYGLELKIGELYDIFKLTFQKSDWRDKMKMCLEFEEYVKRYETKSPQNTVLTNQK